MNTRVKISMTRHVMSSVIAEENHGKLIRYFTETAMGVNIRAQEGETEYLSMVQRYGMKSIAESSQSRHLFIR